MRIIAVMLTQTCSKWDNCTGWVAALRVLSDIVQTLQHPAHLQHDDDDDDQDDQDDDDDNDDDDDDDDDNFDDDDGDNQENDDCNTVVEPYPLRTAH